MRRQYWQVRNFLSRCKWWFGGYNWREAGFKVAMIHLQNAISKLQIAVFRTNREM